VSDDLNRPPPVDHRPSIDHLPVIDHLWPVDYLPPIEMRRRPFGIGVLAVETRTDAVGRSGERLAVAMAGYRAGYFMLDVVELDESDGGRVDEVLAQLATLARRTDAGAFFVRGPVDRTLLAPIADEVRMVIRDAEGSITATSTERRSDKS
jgi:hypothetical protein